MLLFSGRFGQSNNYVIGSQFAAFQLFDSRPKGKAQLRIGVHHPFEIGYWPTIVILFQLLERTFRASASFARISSDGNRLPSSMSERNGGETPTFFPNSLKDKSALSRNW
jgi:hypothetical protein